MMDDNIYQYTIDYEETIYLVLLNFHGHDSYIIPPTKR